MELSDIIQGFILGFLSSGLVSLIWYKMFIPKIVFANDICRYKLMESDGIYTYKIKFRNSGRRDVFEMHLYCTLFIPGLQRESCTHMVDINLSYSFRLVFKKRREKNKVNPDGLVRICLNDEQMLEEFTRPIYSEDINNKARNKQLTLEDLLGIKQSSYLKFYITAHDSFTGSKKVFESNPYTIENIKHGLYKYGGLYIISRDALKENH